MKRYYQYLETEYCYFLKPICIGWPIIIYEYWSRAKDHNEHEGLIELVARWKIKIKE